MTKRELVQMLERKQREAEKKIEDTLIEDWERWHWSFVAKIIRDDLLAARKAVATEIRENG